MRLSLMCVLWLLAIVAGRAQTNAPAVAATNAIATNAVVEPATLSRGASDVVKLFRNGKKDNVLIFYVNNAGLDYKLSADDIIYLKQVGLHSEVITAMLESDKERQKAVVIQSEPYEPTPEPAPTVAAPAARQVAMAQNKPQLQPADSSVYSAYPNYYGPFNAEESISAPSRVSVSIGIGLGLGVGTGYLYDGYYGYGRHFGHRR